MNCLCNPAHLAVVRKVAKPGENFGKEYFSCPNNTCNLFHLTTSAIPTSLPQSYDRRAAQSNITSNKTQNEKKKGLCVKLEIAEFTNNPLAVWFRAIGPQSNEVFNFLNSFGDKDKIYKPASKLWIFNFKIYEQFVSKFLAEVKSIGLEELPRFLVIGLRKYLQRYETKSASSDNSMEPELNIEESLLDTLLPFQLDGIRFVVRHHGRALIGDEMGCGKTVQAIGVIQHYRRHWPVLMVVPVPLVAQWNNELTKFLGDMIESKDICVVRKGTDKISGKICIVPYSLIEKFVENKQITTENFGVVVADESHNIKSKDSRKSAGVIPLLKAAKVALCLSGTPATNRPVELYTQLHSLLPDVFNDYDDFTRRYCDSKPSRFGPGRDVTGSSNEGELKLLLEGMVMIRRLKQDVINNLPNKLRELRYVAIDPAYEKEIGNMAKKHEALNRQINNSSIDIDVQRQLKIEQRTLLNAQYSITGMSKIPAIKDELMNLIEQARTATVMDAISSESTSESKCQASLDDEVHIISTKNGLINQHSSENEQKPLEILASSSINTVPNNKPVLMTLEDDIIYSPLKSTSKHVQSSRLDDDILDDSDNDSNKLKVAPLSFKRLKKTHESTSSSKTHFNGPAFILNESEDSEFENTDSDFDDDFSLSLKKKGDRLKTQSSKYNQVHQVKQSNNPKIQQHIEINDDDDFESEAEFFDKKNAKTTNKQSAVDGMKSINTKSKPMAQSSLLSTFSVSKKLNDTKKAVSNQGKGIGKKIIIFAHHLQVLDGIEDFLRELRVTYVRIDGSTTPSVRAASILKFQTDYDTDVALLSLTACGTGLNLTRANVALFAELYWSPGIVLQAEDRIHRIGQTSASVRIIYLVARKTVDEVVWEQIQKKHSVLGATVGMNNNKVHGMMIDKRPNHENRSQGTLDMFLQPGQSSQSNNIPSTVSNQRDEDRSPQLSHFSTSSQSSNSKKAESPPLLKQNSNPPIQSIQSDAILNQNSNQHIDHRRNYHPITTNSSEHVNDQSRNTYDKVSYSNTFQEHTPHYFSVHQPPNSINQNHNSIAYTPYSFQDSKYGNNTATSNTTNPAVPLQTKSSDDKVNEQPPSSARAQAEQNRLKALEKLRQKQLERAGITSAAASTSNLYTSTTIYPTSNLTPYPGNTTAGASVQVEQGNTNGIFHSNSSHNSLNKPVISSNSNQSLYRPSEISNQAPNLRSNQLTFTTGKGSTIIIDAPENFNRTSLPEQHNTVQKSTVPMTALNLLVQSNVPYPSINNVTSHSSSMNIPTKKRSVD